MQANDPIIGLILPFAAIFLIFYFLVLRPQSKKRKDTKVYLESLKKGDKVVTIGGLHGVITAIREDASTVTLKVDDDTKIEIDKAAVRSPDGTDVKS
jgi:preprotein translocase subunit YajC